MELSSTYSMDSPHLVSSLFSLLITFIYYVEMEVVKTQGKLLSDISPPCERSDCD